jgi:cellulose synthase/poly-beta-1,6-N-acetylglucosamine synthase-like glycosyltransferase
VPDPVCWTEAPERIAELGGQRDRWHRGLADTLLRHRRMILNPRYGVVGLGALPFFVVFELLGAFIELAGLFTIGVSLALGIVNAQTALLFYALAILAGVFLSLSALLLEDVAFRTFARWRDFLRLVAYSIAENFGYRQLMVGYRVRGFVKYLRGDHAWGEIARAGYAEEDLPIGVGMR